VCDLPLLQNDHVLEGTIQFRGNFVHNFILEGIAYFSFAGILFIFSFTFFSLQHCHWRSVQQPVLLLKKGLETRDLLFGSSSSCGNMEKAKSSKVAGAYIFMPIQRA
jgi:hypothetical protein